MVKYFTLVFSSFFINLLLNIVLIVTFNLGTLNIFSGFILLSLCFFLLKFFNLFFYSLGSTGELNSLLAVLMIFAFSATYLKLNLIFLPELTLIISFTASLMILITSQLFLSSYETKH